LVTPPDQQEQEEDSESEPEERRELRHGDSSQGADHRKDGEYTKEPDSS
jgi:hypothetical protein